MNTPPKQTRQAMEKQARAVVLLGQGLTHRQIATRLGCAVETVRKYFRYDRASRIQAGTKKGK